MNRFKSKMFCGSPTAHPASRLTVLSMSILMTTGTLKASDLELYKAPQPGKITLVMMLDTSGSMQASSGSTGACTFAKGITLSKNSPNTRAVALPEALSNDPLGFECLGSDGKYYGDRITELKRGMITLANDPSLEGVSMGVGNFSAGQDGRSGQILVPARPLDGVQRQALKRAVLQLKAGAGTPSAHAYAEAAAYMLGTNTSGTYSGFSKSVAASKNGSNYISPMPNPVTSCDGNGIYFLTDGEPNSTASGSAQGLMQTALGDNTFSCQWTQTSGADMRTNGAGGSQGSWNCIGEFSKALRTKKGLKTAVVGFGTVFESIAKAPNGLSYVCPTTATTNNSSVIDQRNACLWGNKGSGFGEGAFTTGRNANDVIQSVKEFVEDMKADFVGASFGNITVARDPLDLTKVTSDGYLPLVEPKSDPKDLIIWRGNLKKYLVADGTLVDSTGTHLYKPDTSGVLAFNPAAKDQWALTRAFAPGDTSQYSAINVGGAWEKIPVPSQQSITGDPSNNTAVRNVFIQTSTGLVAVTKDNIVLTALTDPLGSISIQQRIALLGYLGYQVSLADQALLTSPTATLSAIKTLLQTIVSQAPSSPYRFLGGVIHSTPLVVNKESKLDDTGKVIGSSQKQYTIYGSMEGGLHVVDAATGIEQSVFLVPEVMANTNALKVFQDPLAVSGSGTRSLHYGVDAPWAADNQFTVNVTDSGVVTYVAKTMNVYGGLRMGGRAIYGLNILNPNVPKLLFRKTPADTGFARMGQIWSQPVVAKIRVKNKIKSVLIFGGGYDETNYEINETAATATQPVGPTMGNAIYIVDALTGDLIWSGSGEATAGKNLKNADMNYSVVGQPSVRDYNNDGLVDVIYFADLGGQVFRVDLNNGAQTDSSKDLSVVRLQTIAKLDNRIRFYERPATAIFDDGSKRFVVITVVSGNRSFPLQKDAAVNKIYGLIDYDAAADGLETSTFSPSATITEADLVSGTVDSTYIAISDADVALQRTKQKRGWFYNIKAGRTDGIVKVLDEPAILSGHLYASIYDPLLKAGGSTAVSTCGGGVQGMSTSHRFCLPYGNCVAYAGQRNQGLSMTALGPTKTTADPINEVRVIQGNPITSETCVGGGCDQSGGKPFVYKQGRFIRTARWFEW